MKFLIPIVLGLVLLPAAAYAAPLKIGTSADAPPYESVDANGKIVGFDIDLGNELCVRMKQDCEWVNQDFDGLIPALLVKKFDFAMAGFAINDAKKQKVDFTTPYVQNRSRFIVPKDTAIAPADTLDALTTSLDGKAVGCQRGSTQELALRAHFPKADIRTYTRSEEVIADLRAGRIEVAFMDDIIARGILPGDAMTKDFAYVGPIITGKDFSELGEGLGIAIPKGNAELQTALNTALASMTADGSLAKLSTQWLGF